MSVTSAWMVGLTDGGVYRVGLPCEGDNSFILPTRPPHGVTVFARGIGLPVFPPWATPACAGLLYSAVGIPAQPVRVVYDAERLCNLWVNTFQDSLFVKRPGAIARWGVKDFEDYVKHNCDVGPRSPLVATTCDSSVALTLDMQQQEGPIQCSAQL